jgi:hypothetical protein
MGVEHEAPIPVGRSVEAVSGAGPDLAGNDLGPAGVGLNRGRHAAEGQRLTGILARCHSGCSRQHDCSDLGFHSARPFQWNSLH